MNPAWSGSLFLILPVVGYFCVSASLTDSFFFSLYPRNYTLTELQVLNLNQDEYVSFCEILPTAWSPLEINFIKECIDQCSRVHSLTSNTMGIHSQTKGINHHRRQLEDHSSWCFHWCVSFSLRQGMLSDLLFLFLLSVTGLSRSSGLVLRITDTNITKLPDGLLRFLGNRLTLIDLRRNQLRSLSSSVLQSQSQGDLMTKPALDSYSSQ